MTSVQLEREDDIAGEFSQYRALSSLAVISLLVGLLSALSMLSWFWTPLSAVGLLLGVLAWRQVNKRRDELTGAGMAKTGVCLSAIFLLAGPGWQTYQYIHEVPPGYDRISYDALQPDPKVPEKPIPDSAFALDGKKVFIQGYLMPSQEHRLQSFLLVRDQGDCCFGGNPKITDRIQVRLVEPLRLNYSTSLHSVAGILHVKPLAPGMVKGGVYYYLEGDHAN